MSNKPPSPWSRHKLERDESEKLDLYTIKIERSLGPIEMLVSVYENYDGVVVDDFDNFTLENTDKELLSITELRQLARELTTLLKQTNKKYVYAFVINTKLRTLLTKRFGAELLDSERDFALIKKFGEGVEASECVKLTAENLRLISDAK